MIIGEFEAFDATQLTNIPFSFIFCLCFIFCYKSTLFLSIRAAELEKTVVDKKGIAVEDDDEYQVLTMPSQLANPLSIGSGLTFSDEENIDTNDRSNANVSSDHEVINESSDADDDEDDGDSINEIVIKVGVEEKEVSAEKGIYRQPSTTEYLSGMVHLMSPVGLLPQFPSWSLVCVGHSSVYSHNSGSMFRFFSNLISNNSFDTLVFFKFLSMLKVDFYLEPIFFYHGMFKFA